MILSELSQNIFQDSSRNLSYDSAGILLPNSSRTLTGLFRTFQDFSGFFNLLDPFYGPEVDYRGNYSDRDFAGDQLRILSGFFED